MLPIPRELRNLSPSTRSFLVCACVLFNLFAVLRALPVNSRLPENRAAEHGNYARNVYRVFKLANRQASRPFWDVKNHAIFFDRNPGLFMFASELFVRAGATTPLPNQLFAIGLWNLGLWLLFLWLRRLFRSELTASVGLAFVLSTPFVLYYSSSIHHEPWCFCFFNLTLYCYLRYLQEGQERRWLIATCVAYFIVCQSYWFYYMSTGILLLALQVRERKFGLRDTVILGLVPVLATLTTFLQVVYALDGFDNALFRMKDIAAARTLDMRIENSRWYPERKFVGPDDLRRYPVTVIRRLELLSGYSIAAFGSMCFASIVLAGRAAWRRQGWMLLVLFAGVSWHLVMIQHTVIHGFAGMYGWFAWVLIVAMFANEVQRVLQPQRVRVVVIAFGLPLAVYVLQRDYVTRLSRYIENARAGEVVAATPASSSEKRPERVKGRRSTSSDTLSEDDMKE